MSKKAPAAALAAALLLAAALAVSLARRERSQVSARRLFAMDTVMTITA